MLVKLFLHVTTTNIQVI